MDFEHELLRVSKRYEEEGYAVIVRPAREQLPQFAAGHEVDILATKGDQRVIVEVKRNRLDLSDNSHLSQLAEITNGQPGWRFDLVVVDPETTAMKIIRGAVEPTIDQIEQMLAEAEKLMQTGALMTACLAGWAGFEAAMRRVLHQSYGAMPNVQLRAIYASGDISREDFSLLDEAYKLRTQIVHGFVPLKLNVQLVAEIVRAARHLLSQERKPEPVAG
jgi:Holliday junction resolvase-like predicted endonuclease